LHWKWLPEYQVVQLVSKSDAAIGARVKNLHSPWCLVREDGDLKGENLTGFQMDVRKSRGA
jgi:hypothetical protein